jgi:hypothetical protein
MYFLYHAANVFFGKPVLKLKNNFSKFGQEINVQNQTLQKKVSKRLFQKIGCEHNAANRVFY